MRKVVHLYERPGAGAIMLQLLIAVGVTIGLALIFSFLGIILAVAFTGEPFTAFGSGYETAPKSVIDGLKIVQFVSVIGLFVLPAILLPLLLFKANPFYFTGLTKTTGFLVFVLAGLSYYAFAPLLELSIGINQKMNLPDGMIEDLMRQSEDTNAMLTRRFLEMSSISGLLVNILIIAILPAVAEELFFRGLLQRTFYTWWQNKHVAVWVTAFLFSFIHFQFYGFLPRFLLGALLGYLFIWSGSLYVPMLVHFLNNFTSVMVVYIMLQQGEEIDVNAPLTEYPAFIYILSAIAGSLMLYLYYKMTRARREPEAYKEVAESTQWLKIYTTSKTYQAEIIAGNLQSAGIQAVIVNKRDSSYQAFGEVEVYVPAADLERAQELLPTYNV